MKKSSLRTLIICLILFILSVTYIYLMYQNYSSTSQMYEFSSYGDIARFLSQEGRLKRNFIIPRDLAYMDKYKIEGPPWPATYRFPLFASILALVFFLFGASDAAIVGTTAFIFGIFIISIYYLGKMIFPRKGVALTAAIIALATPIFLKFIFWGYTCFLFAMICFAHFVLISIALEKEKSWSSFFYAGIIGGLAYLARHNFVIFLPAIILVIFWKSPQGRKTKNTIAYLLSLGLIGGSYNLYRQLADGPVQSISFQITFLSNLLHVENRLPWLEYSLISMDEIIKKSFLICRKAFVSFNLLLRWFFQQFGYVFVTPLAFVACLQNIKIWREKDSKSILTILYTINILLAFSIFSFLRTELLGRYFVWISPFILLIGINYFVELIDLSFPKFQKYIFVVAILFLASCTLFDYLFHSAYFFRKYPKTHWQELEEMIPENVLTVSNVGVHLTWYCRRPCIDLPNDIEDLKKIMKKTSCKIYLYRKLASRRVEQSSYI